MPDLQMSAHGVPTERRGSEQPNPASRELDRVSALKTER